MSDFRRTRKYKNKIVYVCKCVNMIFLLIKDSERKSYWYIQSERVF